MVYQFKYDVNNNRQRTSELNIIANPTFVSPPPPSPVELLFDKACF